MYDVPVTLERRTPLRANPETTRAWQNRSRRALPKSGRRGKLHRAAMDELRPAVFAATSYRCVAQSVPVEGCSGRAEHAHHVHPRGRGGSDSFDNLIAVCSAHHQWIQDHPAEATERGWLI